MNVLADPTTFSGFGAMLRSIGKLGMAAEVAERIPMAERVPEMY